VPAVQVVEALDPLADPALRLVGIREARPTEQLEAQRAEEALDHRVVPRVLLPAHAPLHAVLLELLQVFLVAVDPAAVGVDQHPARRAARPHRARERGHAQVAVLHGRHRAAHDPAREEVEHRREVQPARRRPHVLHVGDPLAVGRAGAEAPAQEVRRAADTATRRRAEGLLRAREEAAFPHDSGNPRPSDAQAVRLQVDVDARAAVRAAAALERRGDVHGEDAVLAPANPVNKGTAPRLEVRLSESSVLSFVFFRTFDDSKFTFCYCNKVYSLSHYALAFLSTLAKAALISSDVRLPSAR